MDCIGDSFHFHNRNASLKLVTEKINIEPFRSWKTFIIPHVLKHIEWIF